MPEDQDTVFCEDVIYSEDYRDYIKEYFQDFSSITRTYQPVCIEAVGGRYAVMHLAGETSMQTILEDYNISMIPALYGLLDTAGLEDTCILYAQKPLSESEGIRCDDRDHRYRDRLYTSGFCL